MTADFYDGAKHPDVPEPADDRSERPTPEDEGYDAAAEAEDYAGHRLGRRLGKGHWA